MLDNLKSWPYSHPILYPFLLFLIGACVSVYASEIKAFLHKWPRTVKKAREVALRKATYQLALLQSLHNNSYQVLLYLWSKVDHFIYETLINSAVIVIGRIFPHGKEFVSWWLLVGMTMGVIFNDWQETHTVLKQLYKYEPSVAKLEEEINQMNNEAAS